MISLGSDYVYLGDYDNSYSVANTNLFSVDFSLWHPTYNLLTGVPIHCSDCRIILSLHSKLTPSSEGGYDWICTFCGYFNHLNITEDQIPKSESVDYIIEETKEETTTGDEDITVVICIDVSGSMYMDTYHVYNQTRLDAVKAALWKQIQEDAKEHPNRKICIITFGSEVSIYQDPENKQVITNPSTMSFEEYLEYAYTLDYAYTGISVSSNLDSLQRLIFSLKTKGQTALGPAVALGIGIAERGVKGSKVVVFTDGVSNIGIGSLEGKDSKDIDKTSFYNQAGMYARERGLNVNVIAIGGAECKISYLASLAEFTEGTLLKANYDFLSNLVGDVLKTIGVAFNVTAKARLHRAMKFTRYEDDQVQDDSIQIQKLGNVTTTNLCSFRFVQKSPEELHISEVDIDEITELPFQIEFDYYTAKNVHCIRVISKVMKITYSRSVAEEASNYKALAINYQHNSSNMTKDGRWEEWRKQEHSHRDLMRRTLRSQDDAVKYQQLEEVANELDLELQEHISHESPQAKPVSSRKFEMKDSLANKTSIMKRSKFF